MRHFLTLFPSPETYFNLLQKTKERTVVLLHQYFSAKKLLKDSAEFCNWKNDFECEKLASFDGVLNDDGKRRIVYMDESYIHKNYCRDDDSLYDPNDEQDLETKAMHKGSRYSFIAAIIDEDKQVPNNSRTPLHEKVVLVVNILYFL